jgi:hypothetical protein
MVTILIWTLFLKREWGFVLWKPPQGGSVLGLSCALVKSFGRMLSMAAEPCRQSIRQAVRSGREEAGIFIMKESKK